MSDEDSQEVPQISVAEIKKKEQDFLELIQDPEHPYHKLHFKQKELVQRAFIYGENIDTVIKDINSNPRQIQSHSKNLFPPNVKETIISLYSEELNRGLISSILLKAAKAKKTYYDKDAGQLVESDADDHKIQLKVAEMLMDLHGDSSKAMKASTPNQSIKININANEDVEDAVKEVLVKKWGKKQIPDDDLNVIDVDAESLDSNQNSVEINSD